MREGIRSILQLLIKLLRKRGEYLNISNIYLHLCLVLFHNCFLFIYMHAK